MNVTGTLNASSDLDVDGHTDLDDLVVTGVTTISNTLNVTGTLNATTNATFSGNIDANGNLDVDGQTDLDVLNVAETATFASNIDANGNLDVDGHTELDDVNVAGVSTFVGNIDANGNLDVDGQTDLDVLNVAETATFSSDVVLNANLDLQDNDQILIGTGDDLKIYHSGTNSYISNSTGTLFTLSDTFEVKGGDGNETHLKTTNNGSVELYYDNIKRFETTTAGIEVTGHSELDNVNAAGITTTQTLHVGTAGTTLTVDPESSTFAIGSASVPVTATMNGGAIPSIGLVIALGG